MSAPADQTWYTPRSQADKPEDERARFKLRGLVGTEAMDVKFYFDDDGSPSMTSRGGEACLRKGLLGWENYKDKNGNDLVFDEKNWKANINALYPLDAIDLAIEVWNLTCLSDQQKKTS